MKIDVVNLKGEKIEEMNLNDKVFGIKPNKTVLKQFIRVYQMNQRQGTASSKTRAEVSGGGRKPWAQKHTGKSRQGSIRSPIWVHGGVAFGPKPKSWRLYISKSLRELAMKSVLSQKVDEKKITILDKVVLKKPSTKEVSDALRKMKIKGKTLLVWFDGDDNLVKSVRNIKNIETSYAGSLNAYDVLNSENIVFMKGALSNVEGRYK